MSGRTWKRRRVSDDSIRDALMAAGNSVPAAAEHLGVHRSTLLRWLRATPGLAPARVPGPADEVVQPGDDTSVAAWRRWVLDNYTLTPTERQLLELACEALEMSRDLLFKPGDRLAATARFQSIVKQLSFEDPNNGQTQAAEQQQPPQLRRVK